MSFFNFKQCFLHKAVHVYLHRIWRQRIERARATNGT